MITGEITDEDWRNQYVRCKEPGCCYIGLLDSGTEMPKDIWKKCGKCGMEDVVTEDAFKGVGANV